MLPTEPPADVPPDGGSHTEGLIRRPGEDRRARPAISAALKKVYDPEIPVDIWSSA
jgi:hypothetical protein